jgi:hypothetical protein
VLYAEGPSTRLSAIQNISHGLFFRTFMRVDDMVLRRGDGWTYRFVQRDNDEAELQSVRVNGAIDAGGHVRKISISHE